MDNKITIKINIDKEIIGLYIGKNKIGDMEFLIDATQINLTNLTIINEKRLQGYGLLMLNALKGIAQFYKKPIYLIAYDDKIPFYKKNDFASLSELPMYTDYTFFNLKESYPILLHRGKRIYIKNINSNNKIEYQISNVDMIWIPSSLQEVDVYL